MEVQIVHMQIRNQDLNAILAVIEKMERHPEQRHTIASLAKDAGISTSRFTALFRLATGKTIQQTLTDIRMRIAKEMLTKTNKPIARIAMQVGYQNDSAFSRAFRKLTGITPQEFRRRHKG